MESKGKIVLLDLLDNIILFKSIPIVKLDENHNIKENNMVLTFHVVVVFVNDDY
jgi:hypothetical protein